MILLLLFDAAMEFGDAFGVCLFCGKVLKERPDDHEDIQAQHGELDGCCDSNQLEGL